MSTSANHNHKTWVEIDKKALLGNAKILRGLLACPVKSPVKSSLKEFHGGAKQFDGVNLMAVVKANAYGHGLKEVVSVLKKERGIMFGVDSSQEALIANSVASENEIMILGYIPEKELMTAIKNGFHFSIYDKNILRFVTHLVKIGQVNPKTISTHLKIETGTNRLGIRPEELKGVNFNFPITGIYTHFADSENLNSSFHQEQTRKLNEAIEILKTKNMRPSLYHLACTAAIMRPDVSGGNLVRAGIGLYGLWPTEELRKKFSKNISLKPVLTWKTRIAQIKRISDDETVGYDRTYTAKRATRIAVLPLGYYDGYDRGLSSCGEVIINGKRARVAGRVCMNMTMVDLGNIKAKVGDEIVLIGKNGSEEITADDVAKKIGTVNYEVVSRINPFLPRICF